MSNTMMEEDIAVAPARRTAAQAFMAPAESGLQQLFRFGLTGAIATVVDYAVLLGLYRFAHVSRPIAVATGYGVGLVICYLFSIFWVFAHRSISDRRIEFAIFVAVGLVGLVLTELVMEVSLRWLEAHPAVSAACWRFIQSGIDKSFAVTPALAARTIKITMYAGQIITAKFIAIVVVFFFNFAGRKTLLFTAPRRR